MSTLADALAPKSDQLNADDLIPGPRTLKITGARIATDGREKKIVISFEGDNGKPWKPCKTMGRAMVMVWAITDEAQFIGKSVRVYRDPEVRFGDQGEVGGIRISHMSHIDKPASVKLTVSQGKKGVYTFQPLAGGEPTPSAARADIDAARSLDALRTVWRTYSKQPWWSEIEPAFNARRTTLTPDQPPARDDESAAPAADTRNPEASAEASLSGRADADMGEAFTVEDLISQIARIEGEPELVESFLELRADEIASHKPANQRRIRVAAGARKIELGRG